MGAVARADPNDFRTHSPRFQGENVARYLILVEVLRTSADRKDVSVAQIAIAWVAAQGEDIVVPLVRARRRDPVMEALGSLDVALTPEDLAKIEQAVPKGAAAGGRCAPAQFAHLASERAAQA